MPLNIGQMNQLTQILLKDSGDSGFATTYLATTMGIDQDVILESARMMKELYPDLIFIKKYPYRGLDDHEFHMIKIPDSEKWRAQLLLTDGGWGPAFDLHHARLKEKNDEAMRRLRLEEESWNATKLQAEHANSNSKLANLIAAIALVISILALIAQFLKKT